MSYLSSFRIGIWVLVVLLFGDGCRQKQPLATATPVQFLVLGDWGFENSLGQLQTARVMQQVADTTQLDFVLTAGDNFYLDGVQSTEDSKWNERFVQVYGGKLVQLPWFITLGNHDYQGNVQAQIAYSNQSANWRLPARYYAFERVVGQNPTQKVLFVVMDTSPFDRNLYLGGHPDVLRQDTIAQKTWLINTLAYSDAQWKVVVGHHPLYTAGVRKGTMGNYVATFKPIFDRYKVDFYIAGHEHHLAHLQDGGHTDYVIAGGGGAPLTPVSDYIFSRFSHSTHGFAMFHFSPQKATLTLIDQQGSRLYAYSRSK